MTESDPPTPAPDAPALAPAAPVRRRGRPPGSRNRKRDRTRRARPAPLPPPSPRPDASDDALAGQGLELDGSPDGLAAGAPAAPSVDERAAALVGVSVALVSVGIRAAAMMKRTPWTPAVQEAAAFTESDRAELMLTARGALPMFDDLMRDNPNAGGYVFLGSLAFIALGKFRLATAVAELERPTVVVPLEPPAGE